MWMCGAGMAGHGGSLGGGAPTTATVEAGSIRLQLAGGQRLGGCVAWDPACGLLAAELQQQGSSSGSGSIPIAILDPQAPEVRCLFCCCHWQLCST